MRKNYIRIAIATIWCFALVFFAQKAYWYYIASQDDILDLLASKNIGNVWLNSAKTINIEDEQDKKLIRRNIFLRQQLPKLLEKSPELKDNAWSEALTREPILITVVAGNEEVTWIESDGKACGNQVESFDINLLETEQPACFQEVNLKQMFPEKESVSINITAIQRDVESSAKEYLISKILQQIVIKKLVEDFRKNIFSFKFL